MSNNDLKSSNSRIMFSKHMKICNEAYILTHRVGSGNFGQVFLGVPSMGKSAKGAKMVAIKVQKQIPGKSVQLTNQIQILKQLKTDVVASVGFPQIYEHGSEKGNHYCVMELLGPNLNDLMKMCGGKFSLNTTLVLAMQIFQRLQYVHSKGYLYRDIKPQNFCMGIAKKSPILYLLDFGLSKRYRDPRVNLHMPYKQQQDFSGTFRYASICSHLRIEQSRRDDLESVCYMLIYFLQGTLPWQNHNRLETIDMKQRLILQKKLKSTPAELCVNVPVEFKNILEYCLDLDYYEQPDYQMILGELMQLYEKVLSGRQFAYDWAMLSTQKVQAKQDMTIKISPNEGMKPFYNDGAPPPPAYLRTGNEDSAKENSWAQNDSSDDSQDDASSVSGTSGDSQRLIY